MLPKNLTKMDILEAIKEVDVNGIPLERHSTKWSLKHGGKNYPPKYLVSLANKFQNGEEWHQSKFSGGPETNKFLESMGFEIVTGGTQKNTFSVDQKRFDLVEKKHGYYASWAVWADEGDTSTSNMDDLTIFNTEYNAKLLPQLNPNIMIVGFMASKKENILENLENFHGTDGHAYKIRYAFNDTPLWGAYMTDIIKDFDGKAPEPGQKGMIKFLRTDEGKKFEKENIINFREEINDLGVDNPTIIGYGDNSYNVLIRNFENEYKIEKLSSYAEWVSPEEHREKVKKVIKKLETPGGFPIVSHSWEVLSSSIAIKHLDKSAFHHHGTGIPADIRPFFGLEDYIEGKNRPATLLFKDRSFAARFSVDDLKRLRLFWEADFDSLLKIKLPGWFEKFSESESMAGEPPELRFDKLTSEKDTYSIDFIYPDSIEQDAEAEKIEDLESKPEGGIKNYFGKKYERDPKNRKKAIELHGTICVVCGFDFEKVYGERGKGFIEVHHTEPLSSLSEEKIINPQTDLVPLCSNCHRIIHRRQDHVLSVSQVKKLLRKKP